MKAEELTSDESYNRPTLGGLLEVSNTLTQAGSKSVVRENISIMVEDRTTIRLL